ADRKPAERADWQRHRGYAADLRERPRDPSGASRRSCEYTHALRAREQFPKRGRNARAGHAEAAAGADKPDYAAASGGGPGLVAEGLLNGHIDTFPVTGMVTGASQSFQIYHAPDSIIYLGANLTANQIASAEVYLVGGAQVSALNSAAHDINSATRVSTVYQF